jgi:hypothetical protein
MRSTSNVQPWNDPDQERQTRMPAAGGSRTRSRPEGRIPVLRGVNRKGIRGRAILFVRPLSHRHLHHLVQLCRSCPSGCLYR